MSNHSSPRTLLEEIDQRQNDVIQQLDDLNVRVEALINECLRDKSAADGTADAAA